MPSKRDERERRKQGKLAKFKAAKAALVAKVNLDRYPKAAAEPVVSDKPRIAPHLQRAADALAKQPKAVKDGSRLSLRMSWCISKADRVGEWSWGELRDWSAAEWEEIHPPMNGFAKLTWGELDTHASGEGHKMHHGHELTELIPEAQTRWREVDLEQFDTVFRFRLGSTKRVWGFIVQAHFFMVWWDRHHSIYPVK